MHLRGKAMSLEAILPDGATEVLSYVNRFNFNWMVNYIYADDSAPVLPKGTVIKVTAWYDNTANSPAGESLCENSDFYPRHDCRGLLDIGKPHR
ncbi:MAG TPA: hypothetical protein VK419_17230 [Bryobacteraceae bacterium]|nr:hypothetical protein [Bryobacteraceae bacterium]